MELIRRPADGEVLDATFTMYPSRLECVRGRRAFADPTSTLYGYVVSGRARAALSGLRQSLHTHPSIRLGVVARGEGAAFGPDDRWVEPLSEGTVFLLHAHEAHAFRTTEGRRSLDVIAFHPDSDWGPTDAAHPMLNRTYVGRDPSGQRR